MYMHFCCIVLGTEYNRFKIFMQVGVDVNCIHTKFGRHSLSGFGDCLPSNFPFGLWTIVHGVKKIELAQKIHSSRG